MTRVTLLSSRAFLHSHKNAPRILVAEIINDYIFLRARYARTRITVNPNYSADLWKRRERDGRIASDKRRGVHFSPQSWSNCEYYDVDYERLRRMGYRVTFERVRRDERPTTLVCHHFAYDVQQSGDRSLHRKYETPNRNEKINYLQNKSDISKLIRRVICTPFKTPK